ncbi:hypothetical protein J2W91_001039 [Paenibacillus amylolyticus]|uniref:SLH domain-containing protein n=1 Tax=Paenibacillus amylolyticus TaxID=1451 RepID=A0AAP5H083_PAEAM|nr:MBG domain-containing protein [Paenibacillus amylolyticus]MDR6722591.1 hypothetical protein [Paenibacillus amylolyticus]
MLFLCLAIVTLLCLSTGRGEAASVDQLDQFTPDNADTQGNYMNSGQSFTAGVTGYMYELELFMIDQSNASVTLTVDILEGQTMTGNVLGTASFENKLIIYDYPGNWVSITFTDGIYLEAGEMYTIKMTGSSDQPFLKWRMYNWDAYSGGVPYYINSWATFPADFAFRTYVAAERRDYSTVLSVPAVSGDYGDTVQLTADLIVGGSGLSSQTVSFAINGSSVGSAQTDDYGRATLSFPLDLNPGSHSVTASFAENYPYHSSSETGTLIVDKRPLTVTANDVEMHYGSQIPDMTATFSGLAPWDTANSVGSATLLVNATSASNVGQYTITPSGVTTGNYNVTYAPGVFTIEQAPLRVMVDDATRLYGASNPTFVGTITGARSQDGITVDYTTTANETSNVGTYVIGSTLNDPNGKLGNYAVTTTPGRLTIEQAALRVTADDATRLYGASNPTFVGTVTGAQAQDGITVDYTTTVDETSDVGTYAIQPTLNDPNGKLMNYAVTTTPGALTVEQAPLILTPDSFERWENYDNPLLTGVLTGAVSTDNITTRYDTTAVQSSPVGTYPIEAEFIDPQRRLGNYNITVAPAELVVYAAPRPLFSGTDTEQSVTGNIELPISDGGGRPIVWTSSNDAVLDSTTGSVQRPSYLDGDSEVTLQASVAANGVMYEALYDLTIVAGAMTDEESVNTDTQALKIGYATGDNATQVRGSLTLPISGEKGAKIAWFSSIPSVIDPDTGDVNRPSFAVGNQIVTLVATISKGTESQTLTFQLTVIRKDPTGSGNNGGTGTGNSDIVDKVDVTDKEDKEDIAELYVEIETPQGKKKVEFSKNDGAKGMIRIATDKVVGQFTLNSKVIKQLKALNSEMIITFATSLNEIDFPLKNLESFKEDSALVVTFSNEKENSRLDAAISELGAQVLADPIQFKVTGLNSDGKQIEIDPFSQNVERRLFLENTAVSINSTVVRWDEGRRELRYVPAQFVTEDDKNLAIVQSKGTDLYLVIDRTVKFSDMQGHWAQEDAEKLASKLIVQGRGANQFDPKDTLTRAETAVLLTRALGIISSDNGSNFSDVQGEWYSADVVAASESGLITGYSDGSFRPSESITRQELAVMLTRAITLINGEFQKPITDQREPVDLDLVSPWAVQAIQQVIALGIMKGDDSGSIRPGEATSRAEMVMMLSRMLPLMNGN